MITATQIKGGEQYMTRHLSANDYYSETEKVTGYWQGKAAKLLGIEGQAVTTEAFEALRTNTHPLTGEKLRPRNSKVAFHDIVVSCPKSVSIAAMVGEDERLVQAFGDVVQRTFRRLEAYAGARDRQGAAYNSENVVTTGNGVAAVYHHDTSRLLEPQLHAHLVFSNHTWSEGGQRWLALQPRVMMEQSSTTIRKAFYRDLATECEKLGYEVEWKQGFPRLKAIDLEMERAFSVRSQQRDTFKLRFKDIFGTEPDQKRVEYFIKETKQPAMKRFVDEYSLAFGRKPDVGTMEDFVKDWRSDKMARSSEGVVHERQLQKMDPAQAERLRCAVDEARMRVASNGVEEPVSEGEVVSQSLEVPKVSMQQSSQRRKQGTRSAKRNQGSKQKPVAVSQSEVLRHLRRGQAIVQALNGHPAGLIVRGLTMAARKGGRHGRRT